MDYNSGTFTPTFSYCSIDYSFEVRDSTTALSTALDSSIILSPSGTSASKNFVITVSALTHTNLATNSPYVIKVRGALTSLPSTYREDSLTLTISSTCTGSLTPAS